ncbi:MAG: hypothetical protein KC549_00720 [Myxococcales bacterium]|nr:hypothetical protein [Myxococcales bacterium]MCB9546591.1 hypothetical protein [Myxococcales bacterium]
MSTIERILAAALCVSVLGLATGCDTDEDGADGGMAGGDMNVGADMGADMAVEAPAMDWVLIIDDSVAENMAGTPGADICGMTVTCDGAGVDAVAALLTPGDGELCDTVRDGCSAVRTDPNAARDDGSACEGGSNPSDYVSLGIGGLLSVQFAQALPGCDLEVVELVGNDAEAYDVYVCDAADAATATCANNDQPIATAGEGGTVNVTVP